MLKAIIADDDRIFAQFVQKCVDWEALGVAVTSCAVNGREVIEMVTRLRPEIVVMDVEMPGVTGLECAEHIRAIRQDCEILLITGHDKFRYAQLGAKYGVTDILLKPTTKSCLQAALQHAVDEYWMKRLVDCAMRGGERDQILTLIDNEAGDNSVLGLCAGIMAAVVEGGGQRIQDSVAQYLMAVTNWRIPNDRLFWLHAIPLMICTALLREDGAEELPAPLDDQRQLMERIERDCFGGGAQRTLCDICERTSSILHKLPRGGSAQIADEALAVLRQHYFDPKFNISALAELTHFHEGYLRRVFKSAFGKSPNAVLKDTRMNEARRLFVEGGLQIQQVAQQVGFEDAAYFSKCFKQHFGCAPSECWRSNK